LSCASSRGLGACNTPEQIHPLDFRLLAAGQALSWLGNGFQTVALAVAVVLTGGGPGDLGLVMACSVLAMLAGTLAIALVLFGASVAPLFVAGTRADPPDHPARRAADGDAGGARGTGRTHSGGHAIGPMSPHWTTKQVLVIGLVAGRSGQTSREPRSS
jgi:hypothetical protein